MDWYSEIKINGYFHFNDPEIFKYLKMYYNIPMVKCESCKYPFCYYPIGRTMIRLTQRLIYKKYLKDYDLSFGSCDAWRGIDNGTDRWHNDSIEGSNTAFLLYSSTMSKETGGGIQFRDINVRNKETTIYPKKFDIIVMDQNDQFQHRVIPLKKPINRDIANVEFNIRGIK